MVAACGEIFGSAGLSPLSGLAAPHVAATPNPRHGNARVTCECCCFKNSGPSADQAFTRDGKTLPACTGSKHIVRNVVQTCQCPSLAASARRGVRPNRHCRVHRMPTVLPPATAQPDNHVPRRGLRPRSRGPAFRHKTVAPTRPGYAGPGVVSTSVEDSSPTSPGCAGQGIDTRAGLVPGRRIVGLRGGSRGHRAQPCASPG